MNEYPRRFEVWRNEIETFEQAKKFLFTELQDSRKTLFKSGAGIERSKHWLENLDNPQERFPSIHIAGTSGKGSVSYFISNLIHAHNKTVGTHLSPHVFDVRERMLVDLEYPDEQEFVKRVRDIVPNIRSMQRTSDGRPTYFEVTGALAMQTFRDHDVDYGIIETGIGGRYDSTNTIRRPDKLAVITRLGLDHTEILGNTLADIAWQKAGIIPWSGTVIALKPSDEAAAKVIEEVASERGSQLLWSSAEKAIATDSDAIGARFDYSGMTNISTTTPGEYQVENAALAIDVARFLAARDDWVFDEGAAKTAIHETSLPGRANTWNVDERRVLVDAAHNPQKIEAFLSEVTKRPEWAASSVIFAAKQGKEWQESLLKISTAAEHVYVTEFFSNSTPHLRDYSVRSEAFKDFVAAACLENVTTGFLSPAAAFTAAYETSDKPVIVLGSMYMLGELHDELIASGQLSL